MIAAVLIAVLLIAVTIGVLLRVRRAMRQAARLIVQAMTELEARRHLAAITPPPADLAFLGPEDGCTWCTDLDNPGDPRNCTCERPCGGIDWCNASGWTTATIPAITEEKPL